MNYKLALAILLYLFFGTNVYSQWIDYDKTTDNGRTIISSSHVVYQEAGKEGSMELIYRQSGDSVLYIIALYSQETLHIQTGYKLLMKHLDDTITELTCIHSGDSHLEVGSFGFKWWSSELYRTTDGVLYEITEDQIKKVIDSPVMKIRIEQVLEYSDRKTGKKKDSEVSWMVQEAYERMQEALRTKKTGLYDNF